MLTLSNNPRAEMVRRQTLRSLVLPLPIACFTLPLLSDLAYWQTSNLMWQHFSEWLLLAGLVFGGLALLAGLADLLMGQLTAAEAWPLGLGGAIVLMLAFVNSLIHAGDGWTAVVPYGLLLSALTVIVLAVTTWLCRTRPYGQIYEGDVRDAA